MGADHKKMVRQGCDPLQKQDLWKFDTLWECPLDNGEATCHSSLVAEVCAQRIRGRLLQEFIASWKIGREHSTYCGRNLVCDHPVSQYSIGLRTYYV